MEQVVRVALLEARDLGGAWCCDSTERKFELNDDCGVTHWDNSFLGDRAADITKQNEGVPPGVVEYIPVLSPGEGRKCFEKRLRSVEDHEQIEFPEFGDASFAYADTGYPAFAQVATILTDDVIISLSFQPWRADFDETALERYAGLAFEKWQRTLDQSE